MPPTHLQKRLTLTDLLTSSEVLEKASTRDALLGHGIRLFHLNGVGETSLGNLLKVSGKSKSQFYSHFKDKDDFVCHVLELQMTTMLRVSQRNTLNSIQDFEAWFAPYIELGSLSNFLGCPTGPIATELGPSKKQVRDEAIKQFGRWETYIAESLANMAKNEGFASSFDPLTTARHMCCSIQGAFLFCRVYQDVSFVAEVYERFLHQFEALKAAPFSTSN